MYLEDHDYDAQPSRTDIVKLELFAVQIEELSCDTPAKIRNYAAQEVADRAELALTKLAFNLREQIAKLKNPSEAPIVPFPTVAEQRMAA